MKKKKKIQLKNKSECDFFNVYFEGIFLYTGKVQKFSRKSFVTLLQIKVSLLENLGAYHWRIFEVFNIKTAKFGFEQYSCLFIVLFCIIIHSLALAIKISSFHRYQYMYVLPKIML